MLTKSFKGQYESPEVNHFEIEAEGIFCSSPENGGIDSGEDGGDI